MLLDVSKALVAEGQEIPFEAEVALPETVLLGETVTFPSPARLCGVYASIGDTIRIRGTLTFTASAACMRCLKPSAQTIETPVDALYALAPDPANPDLYTYDGAWINPARMAGDMAMLALPMQWLCEAGCRGLCPVCGADRNLTPCTCRQEDAEANPFAALQQMQFKPEMRTQDESEV